MLLARINTLYRSLTVGLWRRCICIRSDRPLWMRGDLPRNKISDGGIALRVSAIYTSKTPGVFPH